jgi:hypothetical protein
MIARKRRTRRIPHSRVCAHLLATQPQAPHLSLLDIIHSLFLFFAFWKHRKFYSIYLILPNGNMRQSPRLLQGNRSGAGRSNDSQPTIEGSLPPRTPRHPKTGAALDELVRSLEDKWRLGLKVRGTLWSPQKADVRSTAEKVYGQIKRLFFSAQPALEDAIKSFEKQANGFPHEKRLEVLHGILKSRTLSPISRAGTPLNEPPKSLKSVQTCKLSFHMLFYILLGGDRVLALPSRYPHFASH